MSASGSPPPTRKRSHERMSQTDSGEPGMRSGSHYPGPNTTAGQAPSDHGGQDDASPGSADNASNVELNEEVGNHEATTSEVASHDAQQITDQDPAAQLEDFDWIHLEQQYHDKIDELNGQEHQVWGEFQDLCSFFAIWADTMQIYEVERSYKRLKTQITYVQRKEEDLEKKRCKYVQVVQALQSALELLK